MFQGYVSRERFDKLIGSQFRASRGAGAHSAGEKA